MREGVLGSLCLVLFLTEGTLLRPFCQLELQVAVEAKIPVVVVHEVHRGNESKLSTESEGLS